MQHCEGSLAVQHALAEAEAEAGEVVFVSPPRSWLHRTTALLALIRGVQQQVQLETQVGMQAIISVKSKVGQYLPVIQPGGSLRSQAVQHCCRQMSQAVQHCRHQTAASISQTSWQ